MHNKILIAGNFLVESVREYNSAKGDAEYAKSILLAGAVIGIIQPLIEEAGEKCAQVRLAELACELKGIKLKLLSPEDKKKELSKPLRFYRLAYNSLKHTGTKEVKASADIYFESNLKEEAGHIIRSAIDDFNNCPFITRDMVNNKFSDELLDILQYVSVPIT